ncbi:MAG: DUF3293 domain-containing protein [Gammaproteobacteria bacterium]|nr:DUF3293 domain-containing protein [Pseudomonadota bacterium]QOJ20628.1 MAG: DUF3293 domain-containing protein [Gammaproteobacteria bacterium]
MANINRENSISPTISAQLIAHYTDAHYRIGTPAESITLRIDQYSAPLAQLLAASHPSCAAIISAYNPYSELLSDEENSAAHASLGKFLMRHTYPVIEGLNIDPAGVWPTEKSFFIPGIDINTAKSLGQQFRQNAIVWIGRDAIPRLVLLY